MDRTERHDLEDVLSLVDGRIRGLAGLRA